MIVNRSTDNYSLRSAFIFRGCFSALSSTRSLRRSSSYGALLDWLPASLYIVLLYCHPLIRYFLSREAGEVSNTTVLLIGVAAAVTKVRPRSASRFFGANWFGWVFLCVVFLSAVFNHVVGAVLALELYRIISALLVFVLFASTGRTEGGLRAICSTLAVCAAINAAIALWGASTHQTLFGVTAADVGPATFGYDATSGRSGGVLGENYSGIYNLPCVLAAIALFSQHKRRFLAIGLLAIGITGTMVSFSRGSILTLSVGVALFAILVIQRLSSGRLLGTLLLLAAIAASGVAAYEYFLRILPRDLNSYMLDRFSSNGMLNDPRLGFYKHYLAEVEEHPVIGAGPGHILAEVGYDFTRDNVNENFSFPHNSYLEVAVEFGLVGLALFVFAILFPLGAIRKARGDASKTFFVACYAGTLISSFTLSMAFFPVLWLLAGATVGAAQATTRRPLERVIAAT